MKAAIYQKYGPAEVLKITDLPKPSPKDDELLIKIVATSVSAADWRMRKADPFLARIFNGLFKPRRVNVLGFEISGVVESIGRNVQSFKEGDAVFVYCGLKFGGYAEYTCLKETDLIAIKPETMSFEEAATTPLGSLTALTFLKKGMIAKGQSVMIYGASGSVGSFAVQIAKYLGADVTGVCSGANAQMVSDLGAEDIIDYKKQDINSLDKRYDLIFDAIGVLPKSTVKKMLKPGGNFVSVRGQSKPKYMDLLFIKQMIEEGRLRSIIDRSYPLEEIVEAHRYVEQFRKKGNLVIKVSDPN